MDIQKIIEKAVSNNFGSAIKDVAHIGKGASGAVYRVCCDGEPQTIAVKVSTHPDLMQKEFEMLSLLKEKTLSKIPEIYFFDKVDDAGIIAMEYIPGVSGDDKAVKRSFHKKRLADSIIENLLVIHSAHNDKFGAYDNAVYDTWQEYYKNFADEIYEFCKCKHSNNALDDIVMSAVELSRQNFDKIFCEEIPTPTLIHGDYWIPNFIVDKKTLELLAAVDPFNVMWADPEYELFAFTVGYGKKLRLYESYKKKVSVSKYCDVKLEMYALYSELLWYKKNVPIEHAYIKERSKKLIKQMKKHKII